MLVVMKFGGSSLATADKIKKAAEQVVRARREGAAVAVVVSAQGDSTDRLLEQAAEISALPLQRERDVLLATGEMVSMALMAMQLQEMGCPAVSLTGRQAGIHTDARHGMARILQVDAARIRQELEQGRVAVIAGFQGVDERDDITTVGRGGSDTTAVAVAAALQADECRIYTDVSGVFSADPRRVGGGRYSTGRCCMMKCWSWLLPARRCCTTARWNWHSRKKFRCRCCTAIGRRPVPYCAVRWNNRAA